MLELSPTTNGHNCNIVSLTHTSPPSPMHAQPHVTTRFHTTHAGLSGDPAAGG